jgi:hypothetical protein
MAEANLKTFTLKRSQLVVAFDPDFGVAETIAAQKAARKNSALFVLYLAQQIATFDGKKLTVGELREKIKGKDFLQLSGEILGDDEDEEAEGNDEAGKPLPN